MKGGVEFMLVEGRKTFDLLWSKQNFTQFKTSLDTSPSA